MTKFNLDADTPLEGKALFDEMIKQGETRLKNFNDSDKKKVADGDELIISTALSMPCYEVSTEVFEVLTQWCKENTTPYIDKVEQGYLDESFNMVTKNKIMKNNNANIVGYGEGLKKYLGTEQTDKKYKQLAEIFDGELLEMRELYVGKVGFVLATEMSSNEGIQRIKQVFREDGINLDEIMPEGANINPNYFFYGQRILERLSRILEEK